MSLSLSLPFYRFAPAPSLRQRLRLPGECWGIVLNFDYGVKTENFELLIAIGIVDIDKTEKRNVNNCVAGQAPLGNAKGAGIV